MKIELNCGMVMRFLSRAEATKLALLDDFLQRGSAYRRFTSVVKLKRAVRKYCRSDLEATLVPAATLSSHFNLFFIGH